MSYKLAHSGELAAQLLSVTFLGLIKEETPLSATYLGLINENSRGSITNLLTCRLYKCKKLLEYIYLRASCLEIRPFNLPRCCCCCGECALRRDANRIAVSCIWAGNLKTIIILSFLCSKDFLFLNIIQKWFLVEKSWYHIF